MKCPVGFFYKNRGESQSQPYCEFSVNPKRPGKRDFDCDNEAEAGQ